MCYPKLSIVSWPEFDNKLSIVNFAVDENDLYLTSNYLKTKRMRE